MGVWLEYLNGEGIVADFLEAFQGLEAFFALGSGEIWKSDNNKFKKKLAFIWLSKTK